MIVCEARRNLNSTPKKIEKILGKRVKTYVEYLIAETYVFNELLMQRNKELTGANQKILDMEAKMGDIESCVQAKIGLAALIASSPYFRAVEVGVIDRLFADLVSMGFDNPIEIERAAAWLKFDLEHDHPPEVARAFLIGKLPSIREANLELAILEWLMREAGILKEEVTIMA